MGHRECHSLNKCAPFSGGSRGQSNPLTAKNLPKILKQSGKIRKKWEKEGKSGKRKNGKKRQKLGRFFHFTPPDR